MHGSCMHGSFRPLAASRRKDLCDNIGSLTMRLGHRVRPAASSAPGKLQHGILDWTRRPGTACASATAVGHDCDRHPGRVKKEPGQQYKLSRHRTDGRPGKELVERVDGGRMDQQLAGIRSHLNEKDPAVVVPQPPTDCLEKRDMESGSNVVLVERRVPAVVDADAL